MARCCRHPCRAWQQDGGASMLRRLGSTSRSSWTVRRACSPAMATARTTPGARRLTWLADYTVWQSIEVAGWSELDIVIDETTYTVARDPSGML